MAFPERKQIRLKQYDYSAHGAYFITICTAQRANLFGEIRRGDPCGRPEMEYFPLGRIANETFQSVETLYGVKFDARIIMPNHIHFIVWISEQPAAPTVGRVVGAYKSIVVHAWRKRCAEDCTSGKVWQRNYFEHVIRNDCDLYETRKYIEENPMRWQEDECYRA